jgi:hypothetical protein
MMNFMFSLVNPWAKDRTLPGTFFDKNWAITKNKSLETQLAWIGWATLFEITIGISWRGRDHAGPLFEIILLGLFFSIQLYDKRHWDNEHNCWEEEPKN